ncbi:hexokinase-2-like isoform X2 [Dysidea avara]
MSHQRNRIVLALCGCFSPITNLHLRLFELSRDFLQRSGHFTVVAGIVSPTHDAYGKKGLVPGEHRLTMCRLATQSSDWLSVSDWEIRQSEWSTTVKVLRHFQEEVTAKAGWEDVNVRFLCGADLLESFSVPNLWKEEDIDEIVGRFGLVVISRIGYNPQRFIYKSPILLRHQNNIEIVTEWIANAVSSTKIRRSLARGQSIKYLVPDPVVDYIKSNPTLYSLNPLDQFEMSADDLENLTGKLQTDLIESLSKESHASPIKVDIAPLPTVTDSHISDKESVVLYWTDAGVFGYRVATCGGKFDVQLQDGIALLSSDVTTLDSLIARLYQLAVGAANITRNCSVVLVHSFTPEDGKLTSKCLTNWTIEGDSNADIIELLKAPIEVQGFTLPVKVVPECMAGLVYGMKYHNCDVVVSLASYASNACYRSSADKLTRMNTSQPSEVAVVTNWATIGEQNRSLDEYLADIDFAVDADSNNKGRKLFEKVVSDVYLSDILWRVCISKIAEGKLFNGKLPPTLDKDTFISLLNGIASNRECFTGNKYVVKCEAVGHLLEQMSVEVNKEDLVVLGEATSAVYCRAAKLMAVGIAALVREAKLQDFTVGVVGSSTMYLWLELVQSSVQSLLPDTKLEIKYKDNVMSRGMLYGGAILSFI